MGMENMSLGELYTDNDNDNFVRSSLEVTETNYMMNCDGWW